MWKRILEMWFLIVSVIVFLGGIILILLIIEDSADKTNALIAYFAFMYPFLKAVEYNEEGKRVRKVKAIKAAKIEDLQSKINENTKKLHKEKKIIIEISIIDEKNALIHYR